MIQWFLVFPLLELTKRITLKYYQLTDFCCCNYQFEAKNLGNAKSFKAKIPLSLYKNQSFDFSATFLKIIMSALMLRIPTNVTQGLEMPLVFPLTACCFVSYPAFKQCVVVFLRDGPLQCPPVKKEHFLLFSLSLFLLSKQGCFWCTILCYFR